jgi:hypothetical protein
MLEHPRRSHLRRNQLSRQRQPTAKEPASMSSGDDETECRTRHSVSARKFLMRFYWFLLDCDAN